MIKKIFATWAIPNQHCFDLDFHWVYEYMS